MPVPESDTRSTPARQTADDSECNGAPDLVVEVASPSSRCMDYLIKAALEIRISDLL